MTAFHRSVIIFFISPSNYGLLFVFIYSSVSISCQHPFYFVHLPSRPHWPDDVPFLVSEFRTFLPFSEYRGFSLQLWFRSEFSVRIHLHYIVVGVYVFRLVFSFSFPHPQRSLDVAGLVVPKRFTLHLRPLISNLWASRLQSQILPIQNFTSASIYILITFLPPPLAWQCYLLSHFLPPILKPLSHSLNIMTLASRFFFVFGLDLEFPF